jgi:hypothetical protein
VFSAMVFSTPAMILPRSPQMCKNGDLSFYLQSGKQRKVWWVWDDSHVSAKKFTGEKEV